jgi:hypothetical protein
MENMMEVFPMSEKERGTISKRNVTQKECGAKNEQRDLKAEGECLNIYEGCVRSYMYVGRGAFSAASFLDPQNKERIILILFRPVS